MVSSPTRSDVLAGLARLEGWEGDLIGSEMLWRAALNANPQDTEARAGLAKVLRWQGRNAAAATTLRGVGGVVEDPVLGPEWEALERS